MQLEKFGSAIKRLESDQNDVEALAVALSIIGELVSGSVFRLTARALADELVAVLA